MSIIYIHAERRKIVEYGDLSKYCRAHPTWYKQGDITTLVVDFVSHDNI